MIVYITNNAEVKTCSDKFLSMHPVAAAIQGDMVTLIDGIRHLCFSEHDACRLKPRCYLISIEK